MREAGIPVSIPECDRIEGLEERIGAAMDSLRDYGLFYFLKHLVKKTKLLSALQGAGLRFGKSCVCSVFISLQATSR
jgi:hypothetical protein